MSRRIRTLLVTVAVAVALGVVGATVTVPYAAVGPGPTFNTLGVVDGKQVIAVDGRRSFPAPGHLNLTTVSVLDEVTVFGALGYLVTGRRSLVPRERLVPPDLSEQQVMRRNSRRFEQSTSAAESAALRYLGYTTPVVRSISRGSPVAGELSQGDRIVAVDGRSVGTAQQLIRALQDSRVGQVVSLRLGGKGAEPRTVRVALGPGPERHGYLGIGVATLPDIDFDITINLADVGGPSAGLMFALGVVDKLTPGSLTEGNFIAGTGTITRAGNVRQIGGIQHKLSAAGEAGAQYFLVPRKNCEEALGAAASDELELIEVDSLADAIADLRSVRAGADPSYC